MKELEALLQILASWGAKHEFERRARSKVFVRHLREVCWLVEVQKGRGAEKVAVNLGIYLPTVAAAEGVMLEAPGTPDCQWWMRLGELENSDEAWWSIDSVRHSQESATAICMLLESIALPAFRARSSIRDMIARWEADDYGGLTEVQRRRWLTAARRQVQAQTPPSER